MSANLQSTGMGNVGGQDSWSLPGALSTISPALAAYQGAKSGTPAGYASSAINTGRLAGKLGAFGDNSSAANQGFGAAANALGLYQGIKQGGISGDANAAINAAQLASKGSSLFTGTGGALGQAAGYAAIPLSLYNEVNNWESGNTGSDALSGAETGAAIGSVIPGIGTIIGGLVGGAAGALSSAFGPGRKDPETYGWGALTDAYNKAGQQGGATAQKDLASQVTNPYEALAGMFDLRNGQIDSGNTLYNQYGRMGEGKFTNDLVNQLNQAKSSGTITPDMDASQIYSKVVQPWEQSWGKGQNTDPNAQLQQDLITQMISQYEGGQAANDWRAVGGDQPFKDIYANAPGSWGPSAKTQATSMGKPTAVDRLGNPMVGYTAMAAEGGSVLDHIRPSFAEAQKQRFDDGGSVDYFDPYTPAMDSSFSDTSITGTPEDTGYVPSMDYTNQQGIDSINNPLGGGSSDTSWLSAIGGLGGLGKGAAALIPIISAYLNKGKGSASLPGNQSTGPTGPFQAQASPRTANPVDPNTDWYTYGQHPEKQFFSNNSIGPLMGKFAAQPSQAPAGNMQVQPVQAGMAPPVTMRARGGALDSLDSVPPDRTAGSHYVKGPGDGQSDDIEAKLSDGEYVMDAHTVSLLGNGSNEAGAKRLDQLRENLRKAAAKPMAKGKQFMHAKEPEHYLGGGKKVKGRGKPVAFDTQIGGENDSGEVQ